MRVMRTTADTAERSGALGLLSTSTASSSSASAAASTCAARCASVAPMTHTGRAADVRRTPRYAAVDEVLLQFFIVVRRGGRREVPSRAVAVLDVQRRCALRVATFVFGVAGRRGASRLLFWRFFVIRPRLSRCGAVAAAAAGTARLPPVVMVMMVLVTVATAAGRLAPQAGPTPA